MRKFTVPILNILLAIGFVFIFAGLFLLLHPFAAMANVEPFIHPFVNVCLILFGALCFYFALIKYHHAPLFFFGLYLCFVSVLFLLLSSGIMPWKFDDLWPLCVILCGVCLFFTCLLRHHRLFSAYLIPSVLLILLGAFFLLFSMDVISISFKEFVSRWWPAFLILIGIVLVVLFLYQQNPIIPFPYEPEADFSDDEVLEI